MAIVDAVRLASESLIRHPQGRGPDYDFALLAAYELIDECGEKLEFIGSATQRRKSPRARRRK